MDGDRTLIAYVTKGGVTEETASVIANVLRDKYGFQVDVVNLRRKSEHGQKNWVRSLLIKMMALLIDDSEKSRKYLSYSQKIWG